jgi:hypothetical protein
MYLAVRRMGGLKEANQNKEVVSKAERVLMTVAVLVSCRHSVGIDVKGRCVIPTEWHIRNCPSQGTLLAQAELLSLSPQENAYKERDDEFCSKLQRNVMLAAQRYGGGKIFIDKRCKLMEVWLTTLRRSRISAAPPPFYLLNTFHAASAKQPSLIRYIERIYIRYCLNSAEL